MLLHALGPNKLQILKGDCPLFQHSQPELASFLYDLRMFVSVENQLQHVLFFQNRSELFLCQFGNSYLRLACQIELLFELRNALQLSIHRINF
jgi:hypothetical protein